MLNGLDLFSGIGGISIALNEWVRPITYCEIDPYCQAVLLSRMSDNNLLCAPIWDDIRTLGGCEYFGITDIIYGGFPCQDISCAGNGKGLEGERSGLFFEIVRLSKEIKPKFLFLENVPAITARGGLDVVRTITEMGYDCRWCVISAASVGACHKRERWFLLAHANDNGSSTNSTGRSSREFPLQGEESNQPSESFGEVERATELPRNVADSESLRLEEERQPLREEEEQPRHWYDIEFGIWHKGKKSPPPFLGMDDEVPRRVDRVRALGNAVVPCQAKEAFKILMGLK